MSKIAKLPGVGCKFYIQGKCIYEEFLNPGYDDRWRCSVLLSLEKEYDKLIRQAEAFKLDEKVVAGLWDVRMSTCGSGSKICSGQDAIYPECSALHGDICLLALPECDGVCSHYSLEEEDES